MHTEIELISDGDGLAVIGEPGAVDRFLTSEGLHSKELGLARLGSAFNAGAGAAQAGSGIASQSGRWVQLSEQSARAMKKYELMTGSDRELARTVLTENGKITGILEIVRTPGAFVANPAVLAGAAGIMAQLAMKQTMDQITDYLAVIDQKVDDVLRAQKDSVLADMIGAELVIEEAMTIRDEVGRVNEVTWSKVQGTSMTIARTQAYALRQLDALAEKVERKAEMGHLAKASKEVEGKVREWLAVLARCFWLQDAMAVLELDRVLDTSPEELDQHRVALRTARRNRLDLIARTTEQLMGRMQAAAGAANTKVLLHPTKARTVVHASNRVAGDVVEFHGRLGIERAGQSLEVRRWVEAAADVRDKVVETGAGGVDAARRLGTGTVEQARSVKDRLPGGITERARRWRREEGGSAED
ncbi:hypothetical protein [Cellulomonas bogoriensis]|uniref:Uncharacterized protein n=1 Tax=Cellulomonas bogoriensis 69B4 = DSM 16987 TaxID=1386082 RepID=A0A0A0C4Y2_9CELL|nr:hypothetical protein [Cellulomonas bogoriensis]KGM14429.1 hypothetical protein N869_11065 [Cellulomonas bogoriensis 69B4 = DSM 16987]